MMFFQEAAPAVNPWLSPPFLLTAAVIGIGFIAWLVRLEYKTNANGTRQAETETAFAKAMEAAHIATKEAVRDVLEEIKADRFDTREWKKEFYRHATDTKLHHNEEMFKEFRAGIDRRFNGMESTLGDINRKIDHLGDRD